eukprot:TRINITY_DN93832_c0_g1_i1.p1 TRINITY_DN93832_c0_g1~~TRINITY_DN93832_c0_g1_i1.p1  ORF type:complete len:235 (-),score=36.43 TRINITY_DN93832_c0_g1_i1:151-855(-)
MGCLPLMSALTMVLLTSPAEAAANVLMRRADIDSAGDILGTERNENKPRCVVDAEPHCEDIHWIPDQQFSFDFCQFECLALHKFRFFFWPDESVQNNCACTPADCHTVKGTRKTISGALNCEGYRNMTTTTTTSAAENASLQLSCRVGLLPKCQGIDWHSSQASPEACQEECSDHGSPNFFFWPDDSSCACAEPKCNTWSSKSMAISGNCTCTLMDDNSTTDETTTTLETASAQ